MTEEPFDKEHEDWMRMYCARLAHSIQPQADVAQVIESAKELEKYVLASQPARTFDLVTGSERLQ